MCVWNYTVAEKKNCLLLIIGAVYIFKGLVNPLISTGSNFSSRPACFTTLLFHSISTGTHPSSLERNKSVPDNLAPGQDPLRYQSHQDVTDSPPRSGLCHGHRRAL